MADILEVQLGQQIALYHHNLCGLYTIAELRPSEDHEVIRIGDSVARGLWETSSFSGVASATCVEHALPLEQAEYLGDYVEQLTAFEEGAGVVVCSPYGGRIHEYTDLQGTRAVEALQDRHAAAASWSCKGYSWRPRSAGAEARWFIPPEELSERSFRYLSQVLQSKWWYAVLLMQTPTADIVIGGSAPPALKQHMASSIYSAIGHSCPVTVAAGGPWAATHPNHLVNRLSEHGGFQIAQPFWVLQNHWCVIGETIAAVLAEKL